MSRYISTSVTSVFHVTLPLLAFITLCLLCIAVYRIVFHPLARYPGPFLAKVTDFYAAYHALIGDLHLDVERCHERYGDHVRYGPDRLVVNSSHGLHDIYGYNKNVMKSKSYLPMVPEKGAWSTLTMIDKHMHRPRRKMMSKALSDDALKVYEPEMVEHVNILLGLLGEGQRSDGWSSPKDMSAICMRLTLDVMCDFGFGQKVGLQTDRSLDYIPKALQNYSWRMGIYEQYPQLASLGVEKCASCFSYGLELKEKFQNWSENFASNVLTRDGSKQQGQFSIIRDSKDAITGKGLSDLQLWAEGSFMMLAGSDTTAIAMSAIFFYLAHYSEVYEKLVDEIHNTFSDLSQIRSGATLNSCSYLSACITETMRISPPVPGIPWREVEGDGVFLDGKQIPSGYNVGTSIYSIQHNPAFFPSPHTFIPSRWLPTDPLSEAETTAAYSALNPFSLGPRGCAGRSMALLELRLTVARVLFTYELRMADGELGTVGEGMLGQGRMRGKREEFQLFSNVTSYCRGPWLMFRERGERK